MSEALHEDGWITSDLELSGQSCRQKHNISLQPAAALTGDILF